MTTVVMMRVRDMVSSLVTGVIYPPVADNPSATGTCRTDATLRRLKAEVCGDWSARDGVSTSPCSTRPQSATSSGTGDARCSGTEFVHHAQPELIAYMLLGMELERRVDDQTVER